MGGEGGRGEKEKRGGGVTLDSFSQTLVQLLNYTSTLPLVYWYVCQ